MMKSCSAILVFLCLTWAHWAPAATFPQRNITLIVPYAAGGGTDTQARIAAASLEKILKKPLIVVNKTGGHGIIGFSEAAAARPDGHALGFLAYPDVMIPPQYKKTPYRADDFVYIATFNSTPVCLVIRPGAPYKTLADFVRYARANPKKITVAIASDSHMLGVVMLENKAGISMTPVMYKSGSEALNAIMGGHVDTAMIAPQFGKIALQQGLAVVGASSRTRVKLMPDVPTFRESGYDIVMLMNRVLVAPKKTPQTILSILGDTCDKAGRDPQLRQSVEQAGDEYTYLNGQALKTYIDEMDKEYIPVIRKNLEKFGS